MMDERDLLRKTVKEQDKLIETLTTEFNLLRHWFKMEARYIEVMAYTVGTPEREFYERLYKEDAINDVKPYASDEQRLTTAWRRGIYSIILKMVANKMDDAKERSETDG